jgi:hypothetical protein
VSFNFGSQGAGILIPGSYSDLLIIRTDATSYTTGTIGFTDGGNSTGLSGFAPGSNPEPASVVLLAGCLACLGAVGLWQQ